MLQFMGEVLQVVGVAIKSAKRTIRRPFFWVLVLLAIGSLASIVVSIWSVQPFGVVGLLYLIALAGMAFMLWRDMGPHRVVLWLRRFHGKHPARFPMHRAFAAVGFNWFLVMTIQDSRFKYSLLTGISRSIGVVIFGLLWIGVPVFLVSLAIAARLLNISSAEQIAGRSLEQALLLALTSLIGGLMLLVTLGPYTFFRARLRGVQRLRKATAARSVKRLANKVHQRKLSPLLGLKIYKCDDDFWRDTVIAALDECDAVVLDISDVNENVAWELRQSFDRLGPERIILAYAVDLAAYQADSTDPSEDQLDRVAALTSSEAVARFVFCPYPEPMPLGKAAQYVRYELTVDVASSIQHAMVLAFDPEESGQKPSIEALPQAQESTDPSVGLSQPAR